MNEAIRERNEAWAEIVILKEDNDRLRGLLRRTYGCIGTLRRMAKSPAREQYEELQRDIDAALGTAFQPSAPLTDDDLRKLWVASGGKFHGPNVETGTMPEFLLLPFLRGLSQCAATPPATAWPGPWGLCADGMPHTPRPRSEPMACGRCGNELSADKSDVSRPSIPYHI